MIKVSVLYPCHEGAAEAAGGIPNYTNVQPVIQISEVKI